MATIFDKAGNSRTGNASLDTLVVDTIPPVKGSFEAGSIILVDDPKNAFDGKILTSNDSIDFTVTGFEDNKSFLRVLGKGSKTRLIPVGSFAVKSVDVWLKHRNKIDPDTKALFINLRGERLSVRSIQERIKKIGITQPAMSNALNRLRYLVKDELFI